MSKKLFIAGLAGLFGITMGTDVWAAKKSETLTAHEGMGAISESLRREAHAVVDRSLKWLAAHQQEDGHWSNPEFPALTAFPVWALSKGNYQDKEVIQKGIDYILSCVHPYGAIYRYPSEPKKGGGLVNYNTAVCMTALHAVGDPALLPVVLKARKFIAGTQHFGDDVYRGGMGYDPNTGRAYTDLSNSYIAYEAMRMTESAEDLRKEGERTDLDWKAAHEFVQRVHNDPDFNKQSWANKDPSEKGGFAYHPEQTRAGEVKDEQGIVRFRSMPGMTYAGLLSYIYAEVDRQDPRVIATVNWIKNHWDLETASRDPKKKDTDAEKEGLFYLYNVMAKGLAVYGQDVFRHDQGEPFNWRKEMIEKLIGMQKIDDKGNGYWVNDVSRYWEADKVLVTSYVLIALQVALAQ